MNIDVDICVVGAGPAGLSFALSFHEKKKVLVLEKEFFPRDKICGGGLIPKSVKLLHKLGVIPGRDFTANKVKRIVFSCDIGERVFDVSDKNFMVTRRIEMDFALFKKAKEEGVKIEEGVKFLGYEQSYDGRIIVVRTNKGNISCKKLVIAMGSYFKRNSYKAVRWFENNRSDEMLFSIRNFDGEFVWFWKFDGYEFSDIGLMSINGNLKKVNSALNSNFKKDFFVINKFSPKNKLRKGNVFFIGDSYGVDTLTAEGISSALHQGIILSRILQANPSLLSFRSFSLFYLSGLFRRFVIFYLFSNFFYGNEKFINLAKKVLLSDDFSRFFSNLKFESDGKISQILEFLKITSKTYIKDALPLRVLVNLNKSEFK